MLLTTASDIIQLVTSSAANIDVQANYADQTTTTFTPARLLTAISSATTTTIVGSPDAETQRQVKSIAIYNKHASTSNTVTAQFYDGTTTVIVWKGLLLAGESVEYTGAYWQPYDALGRPKTTPITPSGKTPKLLGQSAPAATTETAIYTCPASTRAELTSLVVANRSAVSVTFRVSISVGGGATANKDYLFYDYPLPAYMSLQLDAGDLFFAAMNAADVMRVYASTGDLSFNLSGNEVAAQ